MSVFSKLFSKQKKIQIDFCEKNLDRFLTDEASPNYHQFLNQNHIQFKEYSCQSKCEFCKKSPYAIVNGEFIAAENSNELLEKLKQMASDSCKE
ncbi:DUF1450 domain-containing protein [Cytobacillus massiliigabonensis]|uniref:DUF1450 domain-containing protein n=1 Tax=Cytobacillus massiliigabonensis TaxID=1871011 RepID=UPI000C832C72|nr:DUF1450 domain-containing protein [Cytobacillus massiliigabonensis]